MNGNEMRAEFGNEFRENMFRKVNIFYESVQ